MWATILSAVLALFKIFIPIALEKMDEPTQATDAPSIPKRFRNAWAARVRKFKSRVHPPK